MWRANGILRRGLITVGGVLAGMALEVLVVVVAMNLDSDPSAGGAYFALAAVLLLPAGVAGGCAAGYLASANNRQS